MVIFAVVVIAAAQGCVQGCVQGCRAEVPEAFLRNGGRVGENPATEGRELRRGSQVEPWDLVLMPTATELQDPRAEMSTADFHVSPMLVALSVDEIKARFPGMRMHRPNTKTHRSSI